MNEENKVGGRGLKGKRIVLGVTGSIAAYKAADLTSKLVQQGALMDVVMSEGAVNFIAPLTFRSLTHRPVLHQLFDPASDAGIEHVALAENCDAIVVAPATANVMAKAANGLADDLLTCMLLATRRPVVLGACDGRVHVREPGHAGERVQASQPWLDDDRAGGGEIGIRACGSGAVGGC